MDKQQLQERPLAAFDVHRGLLLDSGSKGNVVNQDDSAQPPLVLFPGTECESAFIFTIPIVPSKSRTGAKILVVGMQQWLRSHTISPLGSIGFYVPRIGVTGDDSMELESERAGVHIYDPIVAVLGNLLVVHQHDFQRGGAGLYEILLGTLFRHVCSRYGSLSLERHQPRGRLAAWQMRAVQHFVDTRLSEDICLADLAKSCKLSTCHFARAFRQTTGRPPHRWVAEQRILKAKTYLKDTSIPLSEVALRCGFNDQSHFTRVFSGMVGVSPGRWRRNV